MNNEQYFVTGFY